MHQTGSNSPIKKETGKNRNRLGLIFGFIGICIFLTIVLLFVGNSVLDPLLRSVFGSYRSYTDISGSFVGGKYTSPTGDFTCEFPNRNIAGDTLKDTFDQNSGRVVFFDDFGTLLSVD